MTPTERAELLWAVGLRVALARSKDQEKAAQEGCDRIAELEAEIAGMKHEKDIEIRRGPKEYGF